jgi:hypothetical protein
MIEMKLDKTLPFGCLEIGSDSFCRNYQTIMTSTFYYSSYPPLPITPNAYANFKKTMVFSQEDLSREDHFVNNVKLVDRSNSMMEKFKVKEFGRGDIPKNIYSMIINWLEDTPKFCFVSSSLHCLI